MGVVKTTGEGEETTTNKLHRKLETLLWLYNHRLACLLMGRDLTVTFLLHPSHMPDRHAPSSFLVSLASFLPPKLGGLPREGGVQMQGIAIHSQNRSSHQSTTPARSPHPPHSWASLTLPVPRSTLALTLVGPLLPPSPPRFASPTHPPTHTLTPLQPTHLCSWSPHFTPVPPTVVTTTSSWRLHLQSSNTGHGVGTSLG